LRILKILRSLVSRPSNISRSFWRRVGLGLRCISVPGWVGLGLGNVSLAVFLLGIGWLRLSIGWLRLGIGWLRLSISWLRLAISWLRLSIGWLRLGRGLYMSLPVILLRWLLVGSLVLLGM